MLYSFSIKKPDNIQAVFQNLKELAEKYKAIITGDETSGDVAVSGVKGSYTVEEDVIFIKINKKTLPIPNRIIEKEIRAIFQEAQS